MKITGIKIRNFRGVRSFEANPDGHTLLLTGLNGAGKSTVLAAIQQTLFGRCSDAAGKRIVLADLVGPHDSKAVVVLGVKMEAGPHQGETVWTLTITRKSQSLSIAKPDGTLLIDCPQAAMRDTFWRLNGIDQRHAELAANPRAFVLGDDITDLLLELCGTDVPEKELRSFAGARWGWLEGWLNGKGCNIATLADAAVEDRRKKKADLAETQRRLRDIGTVEPPTFRNGKPCKPEHKASVEAALKRVRDRLMGCRVELEIARKAAGRPKVSIQELESALKAATEAEIAAEAALLEARATRDAAVRREANLSHQQRLLHEEIATLERRMEQANNPQGVCQYCGAKLRSSKKDATLGGKIEELRRQIDPEALQAARDEMNRLRTQAATLEDELRGAAWAREKAERALQDARTTTPTRTQDAIEADIAALEEQMQAGEAALSALQAMEERAALEEHQTHLLVQIDNLEWAVEAFRDGRFQATRMSAPKDAFEGFCNGLLKRFGMALQVAQRDGAVRVEVMAGDATWVPVPQLSKGERVLVEAAVALAYCPGTPVLIDDMDALDSRNKPALLSALKGAATMVVCAGAWGLRDVNLEPLRAFLGGTVKWVGPELGTAKVA